MRRPTPRDRARPRCSPSACRRRPGSPCGGPCRGRWVRASGEHGSKGHVGDPGERIAVELLLFADLLELRELLLGHVLGALREPQLVGELGGAYDLVLLRL